MPKNILYEIAQKIYDLILFVGFYFAIKLYIGSLATGMAGFGHKGC